MSWLAVAIVVAIAVSIGLAVWWLDDDETTDYWR